MTPAPFPLELKTDWLKLKIQLIPLVFQALSMRIADLVQDLASSWEALFIFDTAIFILTIYNAYTIRQWMMPTASLYTRIIHDGAPNPSAICILNLIFYSSHEGAMYFGSEICTTTALSDNIPE
jgi:hypothetical protein